MSPALRAKLESEAQELGLTASEYVRLKVFGTIDSDTDETTPTSQGYPEDWAEFGKRVANISTSAFARINAWAEQLKDEEDAKRFGWSLLEYQVKTKMKFSNLGATPDERWAKFKELYPDIAALVATSSKIE